MTWRQRARTALSLTLAVPAMVGIACYAVCAAVFTWVDEMLEEEP